MAGTGVDGVGRARAVVALAAVPVATAALLALVAPLLEPLATFPVPVADAPAAGTRPSLADLLTLASALLLLTGWAWLALGTSVCLLGLLLRPPAGGRPGSRPRAGLDVSHWLTPATARRLAAVLVGSSLGALSVAPADAHRPAGLALFSAPPASAGGSGGPAVGPGTVHPVPRRPVDGRPPASGPRAPRPWPPPPPSSSGPATPSGRWPPRTRGVASTSPTAA